MPSIEYRAFAVDGSTRNGKIEAESVTAAIDRLKSDGLTVFEAKIFEGQDKAWWNRDLFAKETLNPAECETLARELSTLVHANIPLDESLGSISALSFSPLVAETALKLQDDIQKGKSLSAALKKHSVFDESHRGIIEAGEATGTLGEALTQIGAFLEK